MEDGAEYALVVGRTVYILEGHGGELDKFAGGQATIRGRVNGNKILVDSVAAKQKKPSGTAANFLAAQAEQPSAEVSPKEDHEYRYLRNEILKLTAEVEGLEERVLPPGEQPSAVPNKRILAARLTPSEEIGELERQVKELQSRIERLKRVMATMTPEGKRPK